MLTIVGCGDDGLNGVAVHIIAIVVAVGISDVGRNGSISLWRQRGRELVVRIETTEGG